MTSLLITLLGLMFLPTALGAYATAYDSSSFQSTPVLWGNLLPGQYAVGLRVLTVYDQSRADTHGRGRPIQITMWYPAKPLHESQRVLFADYFLFSANPDAPMSQETSRADSLRSDLCSAISGQPTGIENSLLVQILASPMLAIKDAQATKGNFPLVFWSARHGTIAAQSILCEYLASHGYAVAFARYLGPALPLPYQATSREQKVRPWKRMLKT